MSSKMFNHDRSSGGFEQSERRQIQRPGGSLPAALRIIISEAHEMMRFGRRCFLQLRLKMCAFTLCFFRWSLSSIG